MNAYEAKTIYEEAVSRYVEENRITWQKHRKRIDGRIEQAAKCMEQHIYLSGSDVTIMAMYEESVMELRDDHFNVRLYHGSDVVTDIKNADKVMISWN